MSKPEVKFLDSLKYQLFAPDLLITKKNIVHFLSLVITQLFQNLQLHTRAN